MRAAPLALLAFLAACGPADRRGGNPACGIAALAGPTALLEAFTIPERTLSQPPRDVPGRLVARVAAGPAFPAIVGTTDTGLVVGVEGAMPPAIRPAFGVLVVERGARTRGVLLYEGAPVEAAPHIGIVSIGSVTLPLLGVEVDMGSIEDPRCPLFPDSLAP
jgi:hypothetical protein